MGRGASAVLVALCLGCASHPRAVRLQSGNEPDLIFTPYRVQEPVPISDEELRSAMGWLGRDVPRWRRPLEEARAFFDVPQMSGSFLYEVRTARLLPDTGDLLLEGEMSAQQWAASYVSWCEQTGRQGDCLLLLGKDGGLGPHGRYAIAMAIAHGSVLDATSESLKEMADPEVVRATILSAMTMYMMLWLLPEPISKAIAAGITACLIAYLGFDTVWSLSRGWLRLVEEADRAKDFNDLRQAGERFGAIVGQNSARAFVMLVSAAIGQTAGLGQKVTSLPGYGRASLNAVAEGGFRLSAVGQVNTVAVSAAGNVTITLASSAVAVAAPRPQSAGLEPQQKPGPSRWRVSEFKGVRVYKRDDLIDLARKDLDGRTNLERMRLGYAPIGPDGEAINLHHTIQEVNGPIAEVTQTLHMEYRELIHINPNTIPSGINRVAFKIWRQQYWKARAEELERGRPTTP